MPALNCIARLRSDVPDEGQAGVVPFLALKANLLEDRCPAVHQHASPAVLQLTYFRRWLQGVRGSWRACAAGRGLRRSLEMCAEALQLLLQKGSQLRAVWEAMQKLLRQRLGGADAFMTCLQMLMGSDLPQVRIAGTEQALMHRAIF